MTPVINKINTLVVDDEEIVVSLVRDALEDEGLEIYTVNDGLAALDILKDTKIDLMITDIRMSPMDGIELASKAREMYPNLLIIFMTGYANLNTAKDAIKYGAFDYIMKPFELTEIRQSVHKGIEKIQKDSLDKNQATHIEKLSDLSQMLYQVGDKKSLMAISLKYSVMQLEGESGSILYWNKDYSDVNLIELGDGEQPAEKHISGTLEPGWEKELEIDKWKDPIPVMKPEDHPIRKLANKLDLADCMEKCNNAAASTQMVAVPIRRADSIIGILTIIGTQGQLTIEPADLKLLSITASQLALSLENLTLLDETQIAYSRLKQLQDETIQLEKMATRGEISAEIGHELNNFLGVVSGNLQLLDMHYQRQNYEQLGKYINVMNQNLEKMKKFTSNLMDLRQISSKKEVILFDQLIAEVIEYLKPQKRFDGVDITLNAITSEYRFDADSMHIQQLLYNLLNNAADATLDQSVRSITVSLEKTDGKEGWFTLSIEDTGVGIEPQLLAKAFKEKFTTKPNGHGFGLLVCNRIITAHGGQLDIDSTPNVGTTIKVSFLLAVNEPAMSV